jgi:hypothetical protein
MRLKGIVPPTFAGGLTAERCRTSEPSSRLRSRKPIADLLPDPVAFKRWFEEALPAAPLNQRDEPDNASAAGKRSNGAAEGYGHGSCSSRISAARSQIDRGEPQRLAACFRGCRWSGKSSWARPPGFH